MMWCRLEWIDSFFSLLWTPTSDDDAIVLQPKKVIKKQTNKKDRRWSGTTPNAGATSSRSPGPSTSGRSNTRPATSNWPNWRANHSTASSSSGSRYPIHIFYVLPSSKSIPTERWIETHLEAHFDRDRSTISLVLYWISYEFYPVFIVFVRFLPSSNRLHLILPGFTGFQWFSLTYTWFFCFLTGFHWVILDCISFYRVLLGFRWCLIYS